MNNFHERGLKAEAHFIKKIFSYYPNYKYVDDWYDFELDNVKVEVKSCLFRSRNGRANKINQMDHKYIFGRFDFTNPDNRELIIKNNVWIAFIVRSKDDFMLLGFIQAKNIKVSRYITMVNVMRNPNLISLEEFVKEVVRNKNARNN